VPSSAKAFLDFDATLFGEDDLVGRLDVPDGVSQKLIGDYLWGTGTIFPTPVTLDYGWLVQPVAWRPVPPVNSQTVTRTGAGSAYATNTSSINEYGVYDPGGVTLETANDGDPASLASYATTWQPNFLQRPPQLAFDLIHRSTTEQWAILSVTEGTRITLTNTPATWPAECVSVFVDGIAHEIGLDSRTVTFTCSPLVGQAAGQVGPWFQLDRSFLSGSDVLPF